MGEADLDTVHETIARALEDGEIVVVGGVCEDAGDERRHRWLRGTRGGSSALGCGGECVRRRVGGVLDIAGITTTGDATAGSGLGALGRKTHAHVILSPGQTHKYTI